MAYFSSSIRFLFKKLQYLLYLRVYLIVLIPHTNKDFIQCSVLVFWRFPVRIFAGLLAISTGKFCFPGGDCDAVL
jgi:hypothetical protein